MNEPVLQASNLYKRYRQGPLDVAVLHGIDLQIAAGESVAIVGASGSGKSSLLHLLAGLDTPTQGNIRWNDQDLSKLGASELGKWRNRHLGFVFQFHHLLPEFDALDNTAMPLLIGRTPLRQARHLAQQALRQVGLAERTRHRSSELSGGERQRVALARAIVTRPSCLLADEPTGNLDRETGWQVMDLLLGLCREQRMALLMVTHDMALARRCDRVWHLRQGRLVSA